jgi:hypothetical protein
MSNDVDNLFSQTLAQLVEDAKAAGVFHAFLLEQWRRLDDTVYSLRGMLDQAGSMKRADIAVLSDAFGILRELLLRRPAEFGGPRECR